MSTVISIEKLSKVYRLGQIGTGTFSNDLKLWWNKKVGHKDPLIKVGVNENQDYVVENVDVWALKNVSLKVNQGEVLGIIGRNGAGKSTLLKILSRITAPTSGRVKVKGRIASLLEVGTGFHPELTGRENIYLNGAILGMTQKEVTQKLDEIVDFAEVEKFLDTPVKRYSSGMYVRLAFAVAAHLEPEILVVDEVLAVGDTAFQSKCIGKMDDVANSGRTVLFVSHNLSSISELCKRCVFLENGRIRFDGEVKDTIFSYLSTTYNKKHDVRERNDYQSNSDGFALGRIEVIGAVKGEVQYDQPLSFAINFTLLYETSDLRINLVVLDSKRTKVFHLQTTNKEIGYTSLQPGSYRLVAEVPILWLSSGVYSAVFKFRELGNPLFDKKIESDYLPISVVGNISKFDTVMTPSPTWDIKTQ